MPLLSGWFHSDNVDCRRNWIDGVLVNCAVEVFETHWRGWLPGNDKEETPDIIGAIGGSEAIMAADNWLERILLNEFENPFLDLPVSFDFHLDYFARSPVHKFSEFYWLVTRWLKVKG